METQIAYISSLIGDPIRLNILWMLLDGRAYTATELAVVADTSPQNISIHLSKLLQAELLKVEKQGRHRYYRFARPEVAYSIEAMANLIPEKNRRKHTDTSPDSGIKHCRTCYDHLAGKVGVLLTESLLREDIIQEAGSDYVVTMAGMDLFAGMGICVESLKKQKRTFAKPCLDWTERKHHLAGSLGAALLNRMLELDWIRKIKSSRAVVLTAKGELQMYEQFGMKA